MNEYKGYKKLLEKPSPRLILTTDGLYLCRNNIFVILLNKDNHKTKLEALNQKFKNKEPVLLSPNELNNIVEQIRPVYLYKGKINKILNAKDPFNKLSPIDVALKKGNLEFSETLYTEGADCTKTKLGACHESTKSWYQKKLATELKSIQSMKNDIDSSMKFLYHKDQFEENKIYKLITSAIETGDIDKLKLLISHWQNTLGSSLQQLLEGERLGGDILFTAPYTVETLLVVAVNANQPAIFEFLSESLVKEKSNNQSTKSYATTYPLMTPLIAAVKNNQAMVEYIISQRCDINQQDRYKKTPLSYAISLSNLELVNYFIDKKADLNLLDIDGNNILHLAMQQKDLNIIKKILEKNPKLIDMENIYGQKPLDFAQQNKNLITDNEFFKLLNDKGITAKLTHQEKPTLINQRSVMEKMAYYLRLKAGSTFFNELGHCNGFNFLYLLYARQGKEKYFFDTLALMSQWDGTEQALYESFKDKNIEQAKYYENLDQLFAQWINDVIWFQHDKLQNLDLNTGQRDRIEQYQMISDDSEYEPIKMLSECEVKQTEDQFDEVMRYLLRMPPGTQFDFGESGHATSGFINEQNDFIYYDPNFSLKTKHNNDKNEIIKRLKDYKHIKQVGEINSKCLIEVFFFKRDLENLKGFEIIKANDLPKTQQMANNFQNKSASKFTELHVAVLTHSLETVKNLCSKQYYCDYLAKDAFDRTALQLAIDNNFQEAALLILEKINLTALEDKLLKLLKSAYKHKNHTIIRALVTKINKEIKDSKRVDLSNTLLKDALEKDDFHFINKNLEIFVDKLPLEDILTKINSQSIPEGKLLNIVSEYIKQKYDISEPTLSNQEIVIAYATIRSEKYSENFKNTLNSLLTDIMQKKVTKAIAELKKIQVSEKSKNLKDNYILLEIAANNRGLQGVIDVDEWKLIKKFKFTSEDKELPTKIIAIAQIKTLEENDLNKLNEGKTNEIIKQYINQKKINYSEKKTLTEINQSRKAYLEKINNISKIVKEAKLNSTEIDTEIRLKQDQINSKANKKILEFAVKKKVWKKHINDKEEKLIKNFNFTINDNELVSKIIAIAKIKTLKEKDLEKINQGKVNEIIVEYIKEKTVDSSKVKTNEQIEKLIAELDKIVETVNAANLNSIEISSAIQLKKDEINKKAEEAKSLKVVTTKTITTISSQENNIGFNQSKNLNNDQNKSTLDLNMSNVVSTQTIITNHNQTNENTNSQNTMDSNPKNYPESIPPNEQDKGNHIVLNNLQQTEAKLNLNAGSKKPGHLNSPPCDSMPSSNNLEPLLEEKGAECLTDILNIWQEYLSHLKMVKNDKNDSLLNSKIKTSKEIIEVLTDKKSKVSNKLFSLLDKLEVNALFTLSLHRGMAKTRFGATVSTCLKCIATIPTVFLGALLLGKFNLVNKLWKTKGAVIAEESLNKINIFNKFRARYLKDKNKINNDSDAEQNNRDITPPKI